MFQEYFNNLQAAYNADNETTEHSFRSYLQNLLIAFEQEYVKRDLTIRHEPTTQGRLGRPDFKISTKEQLTIGLIETKKLGANLDELLDSEQIKKYSELSDNIILTNYLNFVLIRKGEVILEANIGSKQLLNAKKHKLNLSQDADIIQLLKNFFESEPETIVTAGDLAKKLASKAMFLREFCNVELEHGDQNSRLFGIYNGFRESLLPLLDFKYFSDIYAQTLAYGLFLSALNCDDPKKELTKASAYSVVPRSFSLIRELFHSIDDFPAEIVWAIEEIISILKATDFSAIKREFAEYRNSQSGFSDPFIYFYEDFLRNYDKNQRELRGVYYTPEPVVSYITRSIEQILINDFEIRDGFIDKNVTVLDFACGTGTFLLNVFKQALDAADKYGNNDAKNMLLNDRLVNNYYGFELLVAPYVVAHLKISEFFKERGLALSEDKRLNIFLTNTLTNNEPVPFRFMPTISKEGEEANRIKNQDILVILGNPPYSVSTQNKGDWISLEKLSRYKEAVKSERNIQPLSDDYIKFIRFAHWKMENVEKGVIGVITNNSYLDGLIHRGMRQELMKDFDDIYILNLHGNARIGEKNIDGTKDENIFDIMQGVAIAIFVKKPLKRGAVRECKVHYQDLFGLRENKYSYLLEHDILKTNWIELKPNDNYYFFMNKDFTHKEEYKKGYSVNKIFNVYSSGVKTHHDGEMVSRKPFKSNNQKYNYRPFDTRYIEYDLDKVVRHRNAVMQHMLQNNIAICVTRQQNRGSFQNVFITECISDICSVSIKTKESAYVFPLYVYQENGDMDENGNGYLFKENGKRDNFTKEFRKFIKEKYKEKYEPEQILGYIYAVLHSPSYREKYLEFLKIDFPKIPFADDEEKFKKLSALGIELIDAHLLKKFPHTIDCRFAGAGDHRKVEKVIYERDAEKSENSDREIGKVWINKESYFENIPLEGWNFFIGGYQVLDKWLKERKKEGVELSFEDIEHFSNVVNILDYTISTMEKIDETMEN